MLVFFKRREDQRTWTNNLGYLHPAAPGEFSTRWKFARLGHTEQPQLYENLDA